MSEIHASLPSQKNSVTTFNIIILVFAVVIFSLLVSFNAFSPTDFSKKMTNPPSPEKSAGVAPQKLHVEASHSNDNNEHHKTGH